MTQKIAHFAMVVEFEFPTFGESPEASDERSVTLRLNESRDLVITNFGSRRAPSTNLLPKLAPIQDRRGPGGFGWFVEGQQVVVILDEAGKVDWYFPTFNALPFGWWAGIQGCVDDTLLRLIDLRVTEDPWQLCMGSGEAIGRFLRNLPPEASGDYLIDYAVPDLTGGVSWVPLSARVDGKSIDVLPSRRHPTDRGRHSCHCGKELCFNYPYCSLNF